MKKIAIFLSGGGSNARQLVAHFNDAHNPHARVALLASNAPNAAMLAFAQARAIACEDISGKERFANGPYLCALLNGYSIDYVALAGYLKLIPAEMVAAFPRRIVNIHPALLPKFGGKGMHGLHVHAAVLAAAEAESGPTIHLVNEHYDEGDIVAQARLVVQPAWTATDLQQAVLALEHAHYAPTLEALIRGGA
jgi:phosphoribosylglycinamide formyltransferase 1